MDSAQHSIVMVIRSGYKPQCKINNSGWRKLSNEKAAWNCGDRIELRFDTKCCSGYINGKRLGTLTTELPDEMYLAAAFCIETQFNTISAVPFCCLIREVSPSGVI